MLKLKELIAKVLRQAEFKTLLWTNPSTSFTAQTIALDLTKYNFVEVQFYEDGTSDVMVPDILRIAVGQRGAVVYFHGLATGGVNENTGSRSFTVATNGITVGNYAYKNRRSDGTLTTSNQFCRPWKIYGVKVLGGN